MTKQIRIESDLHQKAKVAAVGQGLSLQDLASKAIAEFLARLADSKTAA